MSSAPSATNTRAARLTALAAGAVGVAGLAYLLAKRFPTFFKRGACGSSSSSVKTSSSSSLPYEVLLFDIEGTTTPISFVKEILFPYAAAHVESFLRSTYDLPQTRQDLQSLIELSEADAVGKIATVEIPRFPEGDVMAQVEPEFKEKQIRAAVANVELQMKSDRKTTPLKALQGRIWTNGYKSGELKGQLFGGANGDVVTWFRKWHDAGYKLAIYSSGSVEAQKLLFAYSDAGDLNPLFSNNFDTKVGMKQESGSYARIAAALGVPPSRILFLTDIWGESFAARESGVDSVILDRPGNYALPPEQSNKHTFPLAKNFAEVQAFMEQQQPKSAASSSCCSASSSKSSVDTSSGQFNTF